MAGAPSKYTQALADEICIRLARGLSLRKTCKEVDVHIDTVLRWGLDPKHPFYEQYARARDMQADVWADEIIDIADDAKYDWQERQIAGYASIVCDHEHVHRSQLRVDSRKWIASKLKPKRYGDKLMQEIEFKDTQAIEVTIKHGDEGIDAIEGESTVPRLDGPAESDSGEPGAV